MNPSKPIQRYRKATAVAQFLGERAGLFKIFAVTLQIAGRGASGNLAQDGIDLPALRIWRCRQRFRDVECIAEIYRGSRIREKLRSPCAGHQGMPDRLIHARTAGKMMMQDGCVVFDALRVELLDGVADLFVQQLALLEKQCVVCHLAGEDMPENIFRFRQNLRLLNYLLGLQHIQRFLQWNLAAIDASQDTLLEYAADDRGPPDDLLGALVQPVQSSPDDSLHRVRQEKLFQRLIEDKDVIVD